MSDTKSGDDKTLSVTTKKTLSLKRPGVEHGTVRQNFSHGRTKAVVVETKKRKFSVPGEKPERGSRSCRFSSRNRMSQRRRRHRRRCASRSRRRSAPAWFSLNSPTRRWRRGAEPSKVRRCGKSRSANAQLKTPGAGSRKTSAATVSVKSPLAGRPRKRPACRPRLNRAGAPRKRRAGVLLRSNPLRWQTTRRGRQAEEPGRRSGEADRYAGDRAARQGQGR